MSIAEKALNHSKKIGIDECEIVLVKKKITTVRITDSEIAEIKQNFDESYGVRIIHQKKIASCQTTDKENINKNIENIFDTISNLKPREFWNGLPYKTPLKKLEGTFDEKLEPLEGTALFKKAGNKFTFFTHDKIKICFWNIIKDTFRKITRKTYFS